jgi:protein-S-isoprenylcysteine O-methyltransferase Ste14
MLNSVLFLTAFFTLYAALHSLLAGHRFKNWARNSLGANSDRWYRLVYNGVAVATFLPVFPMLALLPDTMLYIVPTPWRWLMVGGQLLALFGLGVAFLQTNPWHFLGLSQLIESQPTDNGKLVITGFYNWVRHPLYFFSILFLWLTPAMTVNLLFTYLLFTAYFFIGSIYEERRLLTEFGSAYRHYQQCVPRLIPWPGRCYTENS